jgi:hypothetical protein
MKFLTLILFLTIAACSKQADDHLTQAQVQALLFNHTETGTYINKDKELAYAEFYTPDGKIYATEDLYGKYTGTFTIQPDGCFNADYDGVEFDGCYYYQTENDNHYLITAPSGKVSTVTILDGDPKHLAP